MKDNTIPFDAEQFPLSLDNWDMLQQMGINTLAAAFAVVGDEHAEPTLRALLCHMILVMQAQVDRRRAVPALLKALHAPYMQLRMDAARARGLLAARRAAPALLAIACDRAEDKHLRLTILNTGSHLHNESSIASIRALIFDETDDLAVRAEALEWSHPLPVTDYIALLTHPLADLRFWAAFRLAGGWSDANLSSAFDALDRAAAYDHTLPQHWGWHVDREAFQALERLRFAPYRPPAFADYEARHPEPGWNTWVISPAREYYRLTYAIQAWREHRRAADPSVEVPALALSADALRAQIAAHWGDSVSFTLRRPTRHTYTLEWALSGYEFPLIGGLHRDGYAVVLNGDEEAVYAFAAWYRGMVDAAHPLFLYEWAMPGHALQPGMTRAEGVDAVKQSINMTELWREAES